MSIKALSVDWQNPKKFWDAVTLCVDPPRTHVALIQEQYPSAKNWRIPYLMECDFAYPGDLNLRQIFDEALRDPPPPSVLWQFVKGSMEYWDSAIYKALQFETNDEEYSQDMVWLHSAIALKPLAEAIAISLPTAIRPIAKAMAAIVEQFEEHQDPSPWTPKSPYSQITFTEIYLKCAIQNRAPNANEITEIYRLYSLVPILRDDQTVRQLAEHMYKNSHRFKLVGTKLPPMVRDLGRAMLNISLGDLYNHTEDLLAPLISDSGEVDLEDDVHEPPMSIGYSNLPWRQAAFMRKTWDFYAAFFVHTACVTFPWAANAAERFKGMPEHWLLSAIKEQIKVEENARRRQALLTNVGQAPLSLTR